MVETVLGSALIAAMSFAWSEPPTAEEVAERFSAALSFPHDFRTRIRMTMLRPLIWDAADDRPADESREPGFISRREVQSAYWKDKLSHRIVLEEVLLITGQESRNEWSEFWTGDTHVRMIENSVQLSDVAPQGGINREAGFFDLLECRYPRSPDWFDQIRRGRVLESTLNGGVLTYRCIPEEMETTTITIVADWEPAFRLREFSVEHEGARPSWNRLVIDEWRDYDGLVLPSKARVLGETLNGPGYEGKWYANMSLYERFECERISSTEDLTGELEIRYLTGMRVIDKRLNLSFQVGGDVIALDGVLYRLKEPLMHHPGERLAGLLNDAVIISRAPATTIASPASQSPDGWKPYLIGMAAAAGTALVAFGLLRLRRACAPKESA